MHLEEQLQILIDEAPQHGVPEIVMAKAVAPSLKSFASQLQYNQYYVLHDQNRAWLVTTLSNRQKPQAEKRVIYAFSSRKDAASYSGTINPELCIISTPVTHLLFELFAVAAIDSIIFREVLNNTEQQREIERVKLQDIIQEQLRCLTLTAPSELSNIPPNLA
ncbi:MAG: hypothetical protein AAGF26_17735 [Cyanobacteria bacterium P01_G01_bin.49]